MPARGSGPHDLNARVVPWLTRWTGSFSLSRFPCWVCRPSKVRGASSNGEPGSRDAELQLGAPRMRVALRSFAHSPHFRKQLSRVSGAGLNGG
jgi:hypothetical protein